MFKFIGTLLLVALAFSVGVFAEHDFGVVQLARNEMVQTQRVSGQCGDSLVPCECKQNCACCSACPGQGGKTSCNCRPACGCCVNCPGNMNVLVPHRCTCGCEQGKPCQCANCSVGCGFLPEPVAKPKE